MCVVLWEGYLVGDGGGGTLNNSLGVQKLDQASKGRGWAQSILSSPLITGQGYETRRSPHTLPEAGCVFRPYYLLHKEKLFKIELLKIKLL